MSASAGTVVRLIQPAQSAADRPGDLKDDPNLVPAVSVVIPVVADNEALARLLEQLRSLGSPPNEIVVVDGGSSAGCRSLARRFNCVYVATRAGRGHQLHAGALRASGDVLWFLHADSSLPPDGVALIRAAHLAGRAGGFFGFRFAGNTAWYKSVLATFINLRARFGAPYGDQGLFAARSAYDAVGGFADTPLFEELPLIQGLRRTGTFARVDGDIGVSPRRWERDGWMTRTVGNRLLAIAYMLGVSPHRLARRYRPLADVETEPEADQEPGP